MREPSDQELGQLFAPGGATGPARPIDDARASAIVEAALRGAGFPPAGPSGGGGGGVMHGMRVARWSVIAGGTLAAVITVAWLAMRGAPTAAAVTPVVTVAEIEALPDAPAAAPDEAAPAIAAPAPAQAPHRPHRTRGGRHRAAPTPVVATADPPPVPADLLAEANAARAHHQWRAADALYARVVGDPLAAQTALVASASLHLEHLGDPRGATQRFHAALAAGGDGALAEDARWGLAEAARALEDTAGELRALDDFLAHHASSALVARARARRDQLRGAP
jgi:hypothetical protein